MFFHETFDGWKGVVVHDCFELAGRTFYDHMLVNLMISAVSVASRDLFVSSESMLEESKVPIGKVGMLERFAQEEIPAVDPITGMSRIRVLNDLPYFLLRFGRQAFVCIEDENPLVFERQVVEGPVFLFGPTAPVVELHDLSTLLLRDGNRTVRALGVYDEGFVNPVNGTQAPFDVFFFVLAWNKQ